MIFLDFRHSLDIIKKFISKKFFILYFVSNLFKDIKEAKEELERISQDDILRRKALNRTLEIADKLQLKKEAKEAREKGLADGLVIGIEKEKKAVIKKLHELNISIEQIAKAVELNEEDVKAILNEKK